MECKLFESAGLVAYPSRAEWDSAALDILGAILVRWGLVPGEPYADGYSGTVLAVTQPDGSPAVLKIGYPHEEARAEAIALESYPYGTAPKVLRQDSWAWAMLLEQVQPGTPLSATGLSVDDALRCGAELLARIAAIGPVSGVPTVATVVHGYAAVARARFGAQQSRLEELEASELVAAAIAELDVLADSGTTTAMVHGDFNPGNVLRSGSGWVAIDPKPMIGDPCYDLWPLVSQLVFPRARSNSRSVIADHMTIAADVAGCDPVRATRWAFARCGLNVSWYLEENNLRLAARDVADLRVWAGLREQLL